MIKRDIREKRQIDSSLHPPAQPIGLLFESLLFEPISAFAVSLPRAIALSMVCVI